MIVLEELDERKGERGQKLSLSKDWRPVCKCRQNPKGKNKHWSLLAEINKDNNNGILYSQVTTNMAQGIYFELQCNIQSCTSILRGEIMHVHWNASSCNQLSRNSVNSCTWLPHPHPTHTCSWIRCYTIFLNIIFLWPVERGIKKIEFGDYFFYMDSKNWQLKIKYQPQQ